MFELIKNLETRTFTNDLGTYKVELNLVKGLMGDVYEVKGYTLDAMIYYSYYNLYNHKGHAMNRYKTLTTSQMKHY